ncbi:MAG: hypothetical protein ACLU06_04540 [Eggerthellaceae bacterium]
MINNHETEHAPRPKSNTTEFKSDSALQAHTIQEERIHKEAQEHAFDASYVAAFNTCYPNCRRIPHVSTPEGLWYLCQRGIRRNTIAAIVSGILIVLLTGCMMGFTMAFMLPMTGISVLLLIGLMYCLHSSLKQLDTWKAWAFPYPKASIHHDTRDAS